MTHSKTMTLYVGTYTQREAHVEGQAEGIYVYRFDLDSGALTYLSTTAGTVNPTYLTIAAEQGYLYAANELAKETGTVSSFAIDPTSKALTYLNRQSTQGLAPCHVSLDPTGRYILAANYSSGNLCVLPIEHNGKLGEATDMVQHEGTGPTARQAGPHAHMILPDPAGRFIFAVDLGTDAIWVYRLDVEQGRLLAAESPQIQLAAGAGPRHVAFHPQGRWAYVINELNSTVTVLSYNDRADTLLAQQTISTLPADFVGESFCAAIRVAPSGRFVYGSNRGHDSLVIYAVDEQTGLLSYVGHESTQGSAPRDFTIDPSGTFLLAANQNSDTIITFRINKNSGTLVPSGHVTGVPTPVCLQLVV